MAEQVDKDMVASALEFHPQSFSEVAQQKLVSLWVQVDSVSAQMGEADVSLPNATHLSPCQEASHLPIDPAPALFHAVASPGSLTSPNQTRENVGKDQPGTGKHREACGQVTLYFPKLTQTIAAPATQTVPTQVDNQYIRSWISGPKRT
ncbi:unnamed protein product [Leuciscus chuanchicus]